MPVEMAVEDIIARGVGELRKSAFGEDVEDTKSMAWSKEQVYYIIKQLAKSNEVRHILNTRSGLTQSSCPIMMSLSIFHSKATRLLSEDWSMPSLYQSPPKMAAHRLLDLESPYIATYLSD